MNDVIEWSIMDHNGVIHYSGDFSVIRVDGIDYISPTDGYGSYINLYEILQFDGSTTKAFDVYNEYALQLRFFNEDKEYCISQVQKLKNRYKENFPLHVYINGDITEFKFSSDTYIFDISLIFYKRFSI